MSSPMQFGDKASPSVDARWLRTALDSPSLLQRTLSSADPVDRNRFPSEAGVTSTLDDFLRASNVAEKTELWFGASGDIDVEPDQLRWRIEQLDRDIATIDRLVTNQLNAILHAPAFQKLEASWRGIEFLVKKRDEYSDSRIVIRVLNASWSELSRDFESSNEFDQSTLFRKVYEEGIGQSGADPYSVLIADYAIHPRLSRDHRYDDMHVLRNLSQVAAAAFCPLITNAHPSMFTVDRFSDLRNSVNLQSLHNSLDFFAWQRFRESEDSRFVALTLPQILMRKPYESDFSCGIPFTESTTSQEDFLWGGAAFGMGEVLMRAYADSGWFANIRGAQRGVDGGGVVTGPVFSPFSTEPFSNATRPMVDTCISDEFERELSSAGFLPLCACRDMPVSAFFSAGTAQKAKEYNTLEATMSSRLSSMLNYILCVSRFAHYLKIIARNKIGSCGTPEELQEILRLWITDYITPDPDASASTRLRKPLLEADIKVFAVPGRAGEYESVFHLVPHHELDDMRVSVRLDTKLASPRS